MKKFIICLLFVGLFSLMGILNSSSAEAQESSSIDYVQKMGKGWNLGNSFDGFDLNNQHAYEEAWGNPRITREFLKKIKQQGFTSIRLPFSVINRQNTAGKIDPEFLARYKQVVDWAVAEGFYVMVNLHHDSWQWLAKWNGDKNQSEYLRYVTIWQQLANEFKDESGKVSFESINEPTFEGSKEQANEKLKTINQAFYQTVRDSGGKNSTRYLILPTLYCDANPEAMNLLYQSILAFNDPYLIATVHYYSEWVYSNSLGIMGFDDLLWDTTTSRKSADRLFQQMNEQLINRGIGVVIGEYGLLGYDLSEEANDPGETYKYIEYMNKKASENKVSLMLWDNGQHFDRLKNTWKKPFFGDIVTKSIDERSAYATGYQHTFIKQQTQQIDIPITWNHHKLKNIQYNGELLKEGSDYSSTTVGITLLPHFVAQQKQGAFERKDTLTLVFDGGANWLQQIYYSKQSELFDAKGDLGQTFTIPVKYNGQRFKNGSLKNANGQIISSNPWWNYLINYQEFSPNYQKNNLTLSSDLTKLMQEGMTYTLTIQTYQGESYTYQIRVVNGQLIGKNFK